MNIDLTTAMPNIVSENSILGYVTTNLSVTILNDADLGQHGFEIDGFLLTQIQWGSCAILGNPDISLASTPIIRSLGDFNIDTVFTTQPEFGFYVLNNGGGAEDILDNEQVQVVFANDTSSYQTLLNPDNMRQFYTDYAGGSYDNIKTRFTLKSDTQVDFMHKYLEAMIKNFIQFGKEYEPSALGMLMAKSVNSSYALLEDNLPIELATRNLASNFNQNALNCHTYIDPVVTDTAQADSICDASSFTDVTQLLPFVAGMWYGTEYKATLEE
jgi:hypothetical protein